MMKLTGWIGKEDFKPFKENKWRMCGGTSHDQFLKTPIIFRTKKTKADWGDRGWPPLKVTIEIEE